MFEEVRKEEINGEDGRIFIHKLALKDIHYQNRMKLINNWRPFQYYSNILRCCFCFPPQLVLSRVQYVAVPYVPLSHGRKISIPPKQIAFDISFDCFHSPGTVGWMGVVVIGCEISHILKNWTRKEGMAADIYSSTCHLHLINLKAREWELVMTHGHEK